MVCFLRAQINQDLEFLFVFICTVTDGFATVFLELEQCVELAALALETLRHEPITSFDERHGWQESESEGAKVLVDKSDVRSFRSLMAVSLNHFGPLSDL